MQSLSNKRTQVKRRTDGSSIFYPDGNPGKDMLLSSTGPAVAVVLQSGLDKSQVHKVMLARKESGAYYELGDFVQVSAEHMVVPVTFYNHH